MLNISEIAYNISILFSPPEYNIRDGRIADNWGGTSMCELEVNHIKPEDVSSEEMNYYGGALTFLGAKENLFYLYYIVSSIKTNSQYNLDELLSNVENHLEEYLELLNTNKSHFKVVISHIYENFFSEEENKDVYSFPNIKQYIHS